MNAWEVMTHPSRVT